MEKEKALELLQDSAREISLLVEWFQRRGQNRLSEYVTVWHLVNFKVQEIIKSTPKEKTDGALYRLEYDLTMEMERYRENRIVRFSELYASALEGYYRATEVISDYLK